MLKSVQDKPKLVLLMKIISHTAVMASMLGYAFLLVLAYMESLRAAVGAFVFTLVPFVIVSLMRKFINAPRPYEVYDFFAAPPKSKSGLSFPSRHAFSAFVIGTALLYHSLWAGIVVLALGTALAVCRVLLGIHFIRDVICGSAIGVISAVLGNLIFNL